MINYIFNKYTLIKIILILLFSFSVNVYSQFLNDELCGTTEKFNLSLSEKPWKGNNKFLNEYLKKINYYDNIDKIRYRVPLKLWIYRNSDGGDGVADIKIKKFIDDLNYYNKINHTGFRYYLQEVVNIDKTNKLNLGYFVEAPWQNIVNRTKGCINIYLADSLVRKTSKRKINIKGTYNTITKSVIIQKSTSSTGLSHEIGHYFGLFHPHRNYRAGKKHQECVSRTRKAKGLFKNGLICEINGDGLADTPAEPSLSFLVDNNCKFTGAILKDRWGDKYKSNTNNIMSYPTHSKCRDNFTEGQVAVMLFTASENKYHKYWNTEDKKNNIHNFDAFEPDDNKEMANVLHLKKEQKHTFHKIYTHKNKLNYRDSVDWMKFEIKENNKNALTLSIKTSEQNKSELSFLILNSSEKLVGEKIMLKNNGSSEIELENLQAGWYFIKVEKKSKEISVDEYNIKVVCR